VLATSFTSTHFIVILLGQYASVNACNLYPNTFFLLYTLHQDNQ